MKIQLRLKNFIQLTALALGLALGAQNVQAQTLEFDNISQEDLENIMDEVSANFHHTSVSGANTLGSIFGFELGLIGGITKTPKIDALVKEQDPDESAEQVPHGTLLGVLTVPLGITAELGIVPEVGSGDFKFSRQSLGVKWTITEVLLTDLPVSLAIKGHYTKAELEFEQPVNGQDTKVKVEDSVTGFLFLVSKNFAIVEPYAGIGYLMSDGDIDVSGTSTIFNFTTSQQASAKNSTTQFLVGAELKLLVFKMGAEYSRQFDTDRYSLKLAVYF